jgi:hypothetical protein
VTPPWHNAPRGHLTIVFTFLAEWAKLKEYMRLNHGDDAQELLSAALNQYNLVVGVAPRSTRRTASCLQ